MIQPSITHPFISAIQRGDLCGVRAQLDAGQDPTMDVDWHKHCCVRPLALAMQSRQLEVARLLIERGALATDGLDDECKVSSPMCSAILAAFPEGVRLLLDDGAHPLTEDALMFAVKNAHRAAR